MAVLFPVFVVAMLVAASAVVGMITPAVTVVPYAVPDAVVVAVAVTAVDAMIASMVMALFDPFGFTRETADRFVHQLHAHIEARSSGQPPEAPRPARVGLIVNLVAIGFVLVLVIGGVGCFLAIALMDAL